MSTVFNHIHRLGRICGRPRPVGMDRCFRAQGPDKIFISMGPGREQIRPKHILPVRAGLGVCVSSLARNPDHRSERQLVFGRGSPLWRFSMRELDPLSLSVTVVFSDFGGLAQRATALADEKQ